MTTAGSLRSSKIRPGFLLGLGAHLGANGLLVLAIYYVVTHISLQDARELLGWVLPLAQGCCLLAAVALAAGLRQAREQEGEVASSRGWIIRKIMPFAASGRRAGQPVSTGAKRPSPAELDNARSLLEALDWKVFRDLGVGYFRELGFQVVDQPGRSNGVDFLLYTPDDYSPVGVRCLPRGTERVDLKQIREVHRAMLLAGASQGVMLTTGVFDDEARTFGEENGLELLGGEEFVIRLLSLPPDKSEKLLHEAAGAERIREEGKAPARVKPVAVGAGRSGRCRS